MAGETASQVAEIVNAVYGVDTVRANYVQFWFSRFRLGIFDVKDEPRTGRAVVDYVDKITEIIQVDRHVLDESRSFFRVHTGYFSNIPKCIKAEFIASWACSQSSVVSSSKR
ncbi:histone-lysine N-methyltransferase SETMAR [Trichonephila clavipes]|nr:histone-lysine N-methyltransferase SETMAR [Trichonephila clavipes]